MRGRRGMVVPPSKACGRSRKASRPLCFPQPVPLSRDRLSALKEMTCLIKLAVIRGQAIMSATTSRRCGQSLDTQTSRNTIAYSHVPTASKINPLNCVLTSRRKKYRPTDNKVTVPQTRIGPKQNILENFSVSELPNHQMRRLLEVAKSKMPVTTMPDGL